MKLRNRFATVEPIPLKDVPVLCPQYGSLGNIIYECIQAIEYPAMGSGGTYFYEYWNSLIEKLKIKPFPGSKELFQGGHESESADFYTTGMKIVGDEENGIVYFRISIPEVDMIGNKNDGLITALKAGSVEFSIRSASDNSMCGHTPSECFIM